MSTVQDEQALQGEDQEPDDRSWRGIARSDSDVVDEILCRAGLSGGDRAR